MNISLPQLKAFVAVARQRSFTRAAAELGLTQSAISHRVGELEKEIAQRLFDRTTRQVYLTDAGQYLSQRICTLIDEVEQTLRESQSAGKPLQGNVNIASDPVLSSMSVPAWLAVCRELWPAITIQLKDCPNEGVLQSVRNGTVDFGVATDPNPDDDLYCEPLYTDTYYAVVPAEHPLALRESIEWSDLCDVNVLTLDQPCVVQSTVEKALGNYHAKVGSLQLLGHFAAIFGMVTFGLGIGVVPSRAQAGGINPALVMRPLQPQVTATAMLVRRKNRLLKPAAAAIWDALRGLEHGENADAGKGQTQNYLHLVTSASQDVLGKVK